MVGALSTRHGALGPVLQTGTGPGLLESSIPTMVAPTPAQNQQFLTSPFSPGHVPSIQTRLAGRAWAVPAHLAWHLVGTATESLHGL